MHSSIETHNTDTTKVAAHQLADELLPSKQPHYHRIQRSTKTASHPTTNDSKCRYTTLHYITPHYTTQHYTTLRPTAQHNTTLHYTTPHYTTIAAKSKTALAIKSAQQHCLPTSRQLPHPKRRDEGSRLARPGVAAPYSHRAICRAYHQTPCNVGQLSLSRSASQVLQLYFAVVGDECDVIKTSRCNKDRST